MDVFQGDEFIFSAAETVADGEITVRAYQRMTREVRQAIEAGEETLCAQNAARGVASAMLAVQSQALALDVAKQQINLLRLDMLDAEPEKEAQIRDEIEIWQSHAEILRDVLEIGRDQLGRLSEQTGVSF